MLAEKVIELLDQVRRCRGGGPEDVDEDLIDTDAARLSRSSRSSGWSSMGIGWDPTDESVIIEAHGESDSDDVPDIGDDVDPDPTR